MTNINCSENCTHQKDGKCCLDVIGSIFLSTHKNGCVYYEARLKKSITEYTESDYYDFS